MGRLGPLLGRLGAVAEAIWHYFSRWKGQFRRNLLPVQAKDSKKADKIFGTNFRRSFLGFLCLRGYPRKSVGGKGAETAGESLGKSSMERRHTRLHASFARLSGAEEQGEISFPVQEKDSKKADNIFGANFRRYFLGFLCLKVSGGVNSWALGGTLGKVWKARRRKLQGKA